jgi:hypothetical protein
MKGITDALGASRSNLYEKREEGRIPRWRRYRKTEDDALFPLIREITDARPTYVYPRIMALLNQRLVQLGRPRASSQAYGKADPHARWTGDYASKQHALVFGRLRNPMLERGDCLGGFLPRLLRSRGDELHRHHGRDLRGDGPGSDGGDDRIPLRDCGSPAPPDRVAL